MKRKDFKYQSFFCEENIWHLAHDLSGKFELSNLQILFFINECKTVLLMNQRAFEGTGIGCWDYHVVLLDLSRRQIIDFDSNLSFASEVQSYLSSTFPHQELVDKSHQTTVRVIAAEDYLNFFSSDRSHMLDSTGKEIAEFPSWKAVTSADEQKLELKDLTDSKYVDSRLNDIPVEEFGRSLKDAE